jgi:hypothetical protein
MATAALQREVAATAVMGAWWRRRDPYVLTPIVAIHVVSLGPALHWAGNYAIVLGIILAQAFLLAAWAALGGLKVLPRLGIVSLVFVCGLASCVLAERADLHERLDSLLELGLIGGLVVSCFAAPLLPLRRLLGWRIDFDAIHYRHLRGRRGQLALLDFAALCCGLAIPLTIARLSEEYLGSEGSGGWLSFFSLLGLVGATAAPVSCLILACRRPLAAIMAAVGWTIIISGMHSLLTLWVKDLDIFGGAVGWGATPQIAAFHAGVAATCAGTFGLLRLLGLKLLVVLAPATAPSTSYVAESKLSATVM